MMTMHQAMFLFLTSLVIASAVCRDDECVATNATDAAQASAMLQVKTSKVNIDVQSVAAHGQSVAAQPAQSQASHTCISDTLKAVHVQATRTHQERLAKGKQTSVSKLGHGTKEPLHGKTPTEACSPVNGIAQGNPCSVDMGPGVPAKEGGCTSSFSSYCSVGQIDQTCLTDTPRGPHVIKGTKCTFEGHEGTCSFFLNHRHSQDGNAVCNIWPIEDKGGSGVPAMLHGKTPTEACSPVNGIAAANPCSVDMGTTGVPAAEGTCMGSPETWCNVGQETTTCSVDTPQGPKPAEAGTKCNFQGFEGTCGFFLQHLHSQSGNYVCNIWPVKDAIEGPADAKDPYVACSHLSSYVVVPPTLSKSCQVDMGPDDPGHGAGRGVCVGVTRGMWWCDLGQRDGTCQGPSDASGTACTFLAKEGKCSSDVGSMKGALGVLYCNIWPVGGTVATEVPNSLKEAVTKGSKVLPVVSNSMFSIGQEIIIGEGTPIEEFNKIVGFGSLILETPVQNDHGAGVLITAKASDGETTTTKPTEGETTTKKPAEEETTTTKPAEEETTPTKPAEDTTPTTLSGATASVDAAGFKAITSLCCPVEMESFFYRLLESKGFSSCSKPHVQGLMHWFSCVPDMDFEHVLDVITNGNPCKYWAPTGTACPALSPECAGNWCS